MIRYDFDTIDGTWVASLLGSYRKMADGTMRQMIIRTASGITKQEAKEKRMTKPNESDTIARLCLGLVIFLVMRFAPRAVEWWNKRNRQEGT